MRTLIATNDHYRVASVIFYDGDVVEPKNTRRQNYTQSEVRRNKAKVTAERATGACSKVEVVANEYYANSHNLSPARGDTIIVMADNHPARKLALEKADAVSCQVISAANSNTGAEAWWYNPLLRGKYGTCFMDPRSRWPEINTRTNGDPLTSCQSDQAIEANPQLPVANMSAACHALRMWDFHRRVVHTIAEDDRHLDEVLPICIRSGPIYSTVYYLKEGFMSII